MDAYDASPPRRSPRGADPLDQRLDRWVSTGRQFVDGVVGARPGTRPMPRAGERRAAARPGLEGLGRWVEDRLDWLLEDGEDWREPWQDPAPRRRLAAPLEPPARPLAESTGARPAVPAPPRQRRGLEAVSRRGPAALPPRLDAGPAAVPPGGIDPAAADWPDEESFRLPRWQRPPLSTPSQAAADAAGEGNTDAAAAAWRRPARPLPRSSRRR